MALPQISIAHLYGFALCQLANDNQPSLALILAPGYHFIQAEGYGILLLLCLFLHVQIYMNCSA